MSKLINRSFACIVSLVVIGLSAMSIAHTPCPDPAWTWSQTCISCKRKPSCFDRCGNNPSYGSYSFCGSVDYVQGCRRVVVRTMVCPNCPEDPITSGHDYKDECTLAGVCHGGVDCY